MLTILSERLRQLLEYKKMSFAQLAEKADVPVETVRNLYYAKVKDPKVSTLLAISQALNVSVNYLLGGSVFTEDEMSLIGNYRQCGNHGRSLLLLLSKYEADLSLKERNTTNRHRVPCIVPINEMREGLPFESSEVVDLYVNQPEAYLAIHFNSNHFAPVYCKGDKVLLADRFPNHGEKGLFTIDCMVYCRTLLEDVGGYTLKCLNGFGQDFYFKRMDELSCMGTCIGIVRED